MNIILWIVLILVLLFFGSRMLPVKGVQQVRPEQLRSSLKNKHIQFIDVRTPEEYRANHIKQFNNIPLHALRKSTHDLKPDQPIVLICQSGARSMQAARILKKAGFSNISNVAGGMNVW